MFFCVYIFELCTDKVIKSSCLVIKILKLARAYKEHTQFIFENVFEKPLDRKESEHAIKKVYVFLLASSQSIRVPLPGGKFCPNLDKIIGKVA